MTAVIIATRHGLWFPRGLADQAKSHAEEAQRRAGMEHRMESSFREKLFSMKDWRNIATAFFMEWKMVWKEILFGLLSPASYPSSCPQGFWNAIFLVSDSGAQENPGVVTVVENALVAPFIAFFTFIGSMGNVPLAAMLWSRKASFGDVMAFLGLISSLHSRPARRQDFVLWAPTVLTWADRKVQRRYAARMLLHCVDPNFR